MVRGSMVRGSMVRGSMVRGSILVAAASAVAALGCHSACDEVRLRQAASSLAARSFEERSVGLELLGEACPSLPSGLRWSLLAELGQLPADQRAAVAIDRADDVQWTELLVHTCPRALEPLVREPTAEAQGRLVRQRCELDRDGLLAPDEPFFERDLGSLMLYDWLVAQRVDQTLAQAVVRPLLTAHASPEEREALCLRDVLLCGEVLETWGLEPPSSSMDVPLAARPLIFVPASAPAVEQGALRSLLEGRRPAGGVPRELPPLSIAAHRTTPMATLLDVMAAAMQAGHGSLEVVTRGEIGLHRLPLATPHPPPDPADDVERERPLELVFEVGHGGVRALLRGSSPQLFPALPSCRSPAGCHDREGITAFVTRLKEAFPHEAVARFRVERDLSLEAFVSVVDLVRGEGCRLARAVQGEAIPDQCLFWDAVLELGPGEPDLRSLGAAPRG